MRAGIPKIELTMAQSTLIFSLPELEIIVERFLVQGKLVPEAKR